MRASNQFGVQAADPTHESAIPGVLLGAQRLPGNQPRIDRRRRRHEQGYLLLAVLLMMAFMIIAATIAAPRVVQQLQRDREEEMIHRGTEYARAVKKYYKKFGRYPANLEQLDNTNQIRFLRKRYKDPLTKDGKWKLLNYGDIQTVLNTNAPGTPAASLAAQGQSAFGQANAGASSAATGAAASQSSTPAPGNITSTSTTGFSSGSPFQQQPGAAGGFAGSSPQGSAQPGNSPFTNTFSLGSSSSSSPAAQGSANSNQTGTSGFSLNPAGGNQTFGGGAIVGVASLSKDPTIRIYNKKKTYNEWQFIYNPLMDQMNVLLRGPYQPTTIGGGQVGIPAGQLNSQQSGLSQPASGTGQPQNPPQQTPPAQGPYDSNKY